MKSPEEGDKPDKKEEKDRGSNKYEAVFPGVQCKSLRK